MNHPLKNTGLIEQPPFLTDWIAGAESGLQAIDLRPDGQWDADLPTEERQLNMYFESNLCVTFSGLNVIETIVNHKIKNKLFPEATIKAITDLGFLDENGIFNCNEMFSANMNGSTVNGNALGNFWLSVRRDGLLPQKDWKDVYKDIHGFTELYIPVPQGLKDKAKKILDILDFNYQWVLTGTPDTVALETHLKQSPLHVATPVCPTWNDGFVKVCDTKQCAHATTIYGFTDGQYFKDFDHYNPFDKKLQWGYYIPYAISCTVNEKVIATPEKPIYQFIRPLKYTMRNTDVLALQKILIYEGFLNKDLATGYFGQNTKNAVMKFQQKYAKDILIPAGADSPTGYVGPLTIQKLNELYSVETSPSTTSEKSKNWIEILVDIFRTLFR